MKIQLEKFNCEFTTSCHEPVNKQGLRVSSVRFIMGSSELASECKEGGKNTSLRKWGEGYVFKFQTLLKKRELARLQTDWAFNTIFAWAEIVEVSPDLILTDILTDEMLLMCGCGDISKDEYIQKYAEGVKKTRVTKIRFITHPYDMFVDPTTAASSKSKATSTVVAHSMSKEDLKKIATNFREEGEALLSNSKHHLTNTNTNEFKTAVEQAFKKQKTLTHSDMEKAIATAFSSWHAKNKPVNRDASTGSAKPKFSKHTQFSLGNGGVSVSGVGTVEGGVEDKRETVGAGMRAGLGTGAGMEAGMGAAMMGAGMKAGMGVDMMGAWKGPIPGVQVVVFNDCAGTARLLVSAANYIRQLRSNSCRAVSFIGS